MKIIIQEGRYEKKKSLDLFNDFKKEYKEEKKIFIPKLFYFLEFFKKKKDVFFSIDLRDLKEEESLGKEELEGVEYILVNNQNDIQKYLSYKKKLIYLFYGFDILEIQKIKKELIILFKKRKQWTDKEYNVVLKNIHLVIPFESMYNEDEILKNIILIRKLLLTIIEKKDLKKIKIILKNNFSDFENQAILENKILNLDGVYRD